MPAELPWTDDRIAILKALRADGLSAAAIAKRLGGLSRSAVLGKIYRLRRDGDRLAAVPNKEPAKSGPSDADAQMHRASTPRRTAPSPAKQSSPQPHPGKTLLELGNGDCRWPHGDPGTRGFYFCGESGADFACGRPYCARHARLAYGDAASSAQDDEGPVIAVRHSPSIAPAGSPRHSLWRAAAIHPAPRWR